MTRKVFWEDPYLSRMDTALTSINNNDITVEQTIFYAFSGGQESDHGMLGNRKILEARKTGREIIYTLENTHGLSVGDILPMQIDWERRYMLMRLHFAAELVLEAVYRAFPGIEKIGAHIAQEKARIDFLWPESLSAHLPEIEDRVNQLIAQDHEIISAFSDEQNERRYWEVQGFAKVACGGAHLKRTGEIGSVRLKRDNIGKGRERINIYVGDRSK